MIDCDEKTIDCTLTAATNVHKELGPGLLESVYQGAMLVELATLGLSARGEVPIPAIYRGQDLGTGFRADIVVEDRLLLELKANKGVEDVHLAQILTYLKLLGFKRGFLLNFNVPLMKSGIKRVSL